MTLVKLLRRFALPQVVITAVYAYKYRCMISPRAEVELSPLLKLGRGTQIGSFTKIKASDGPLEIGKGVSIANSCFIASHEGGVTIGDDCLISPNVCIIGNNYKYDRLDIPICQQQKTSRGIVIEENVWVGAGVVILDGTHIEAGVIVVPNSVVSGNVPRNSIVQGNPATVIFNRR